MRTEKLLRLVRTRNWERLYEEWDSEGIRRVEVYTKALRNFDEATCLAEKILELAARQIDSAETIDEVEKTVADLINLSQEIRLMAKKLEEALD